MIADAIYDEIRRALWFRIATGDNWHLKLLDYRQYKKWLRHMTGFERVCHASIVPCSVVA